MRERLRGGSVHFSRLGWSAAVGAFVWLAAIVLDSSRLTGLEVGGAACAAVFLALLLYAVGSSPRP
jgi:hypothetical protein